MRYWLLSLVLAVSAAAAPSNILNVSYDVTREFYQQYNTLFARAYQVKHGITPTVDLSNGGSSKQARAVIDGLEADVVTMNQETDIEAIVQAGLIDSDWKSRLPNNSAPYTSTIVFLVRKGNPKGIRDWGDLVAPGVSVIVPNPKTSGNGRYSYLAAWAYAKLRQAAETPRPSNSSGALSKRSGARDGRARRHEHLRAKRNRRCVAHL
jgi:sulfate transport system substrate-binding protein